MEAYKLPNFLEPMAPVRIQPLKGGCHACGMRAICLGKGLAPHEVIQLAAITKRRSLSQGEILFRAGDTSRKLYAVFQGHFKTAQASLDGVQQVIGFHMAGDLIGLDALALASHQCEATALVDSVVCEIPIDQLEQLCADMPPLLHQFLQLMSNEIAREQTMMCQLGSFTAHQRLARFLLDLVHMYAERGLPTLDFRLHMSREEIGNHLGMAVESVSRVLSSLQRDGCLTAKKRMIHIIDAARLEQIAEGAVCTP